MLGDFTSITEAVNFAFYFTVIISTVLLVGITGLMIFFVFKYHRSRHPKAQPVAQSHALLEVIWTAVPTVLVLAMFYYGWMGYRLMRTPPADAMPVTAEARMWSWNFKYENGKTSPELYVPQGRPIKVNLWSGDVLHAFFVPAFMVKNDIVPGMETFVWFQAEELGSYDIFCAEYCGQRHSYMISKVHVIPPEEFDQWVQEDVEEVKVDEEATGGEREAQLVRLGERLSIMKGCNACHTVDGEKLVGPTYKGLYGKTETVITDGKPRQITVDDEYIKKSIVDPNADMVEGYQPLMPAQAGLNDTELEALVAYIKSLQ